MLNITERHQFILQKLKEDGRVNIQELIDLMEVSGVTIRKDLKLLEEKQLLFRTRGGGSLNNPYAMERHINEKELINASEKKKIARDAARSEEHTSELQSLMRKSYAVLCSQK